MIHRVRTLALLLVATACAPAPAFQSNLHSSIAPRAGASTGKVDSGEEARWAQHARDVTIVRDDWGIAHVRGRTDADAVFGMIYAQAEDDFNRIEMNYLDAMGRRAEAEGERAVIQDLRMKLFIQPDSMRALYARSPEWLVALMDAWADGLNYYLHTHPDVRPKVLTHFEPWMALTFSEGSIGGDIERVSLRELASFYGKHRVSAAPSTAPPRYVEPTGSNGIAIMPKITRDGHALLLINPHTSFFFRSELQMASDEGLDAYGAATWGQFFIYQGFNDRLGWMHTSSAVDNVDEFLETIVQRGDSLFYRYGSELRPVQVRRVTVPFRTQKGMASRTYTVYATHHGPIVRQVGDKWVSIALMQRPMEALEQSYLRTKARSYAEYRKVMELHANSSNNTIYADADGHIAYFHPQFIPIRNDSFDYTRPVDGSNPATDWHGLHGVEDAPFLLDPATGWLYNSNNWPYSAAGPDSPKRANFPRYMDTAGENPRGIHALRLLTGRTGWTRDGLRAAAFDSYLPAFAELIPPLVAAYDSAAPSDPLKVKLAEPVKALRTWDYRWGANSVPTALAIYWGQELWARTIASARRAQMADLDYMAHRTSLRDKLEALSAAVDTLGNDFGTWRTPWGEINRFQRLTGDIVQQFDDAAPSIPVPFTSSQWGSLASFGARRYPGTKRMYGTNGNSFVAVVEFGPRVRAVAVTAGGESGHPSSPHFNDEALRYASGNLREVYYYPDQLHGHTERTYHPGQ